MRVSFSSAVVSSLESDPAARRSLALFSAFSCLSVASSSSFRARSFSLCSHSGERSLSSVCAYRRSENCARRKCTRRRSLREEAGSRFRPWDAGKGGTNREFGSRVARYTALTP